MRDLNPFVRDSNHFHQAEFFGIGIRIVPWRIWITFFIFAWTASVLMDCFDGFESNTWGFESEHQKIVLSVHWWKSLRYFYISLKHLISLISNHNMSVLVSSKSTKVQQSPIFDDDKTPYQKNKVTISIITLKLSLNTCIIENRKLGRVSFEK